MYKPSDSQERPHFSSADVRKETKNGALSRLFFGKKMIFINRYITGRAAFGR